MAFERISLNIIPDGEMPVFHASQFDAGRPIIIDLYNGDDAYTPAAGVTFELHCRKVDDNIVTLDTYEVDGNTITFASTEQLCACSGDNLCEVAIILDELLMGTLNFILHVERDPLAGGLTSETSIYNLTQQIDDIISGEGYVKDTDLDVLQSDWDEADPTSPAYIKNKPSSGTQVQSDWTEADTTSPAYIQNKPTLATVATTGDYDDLLNKPAIPAAQVNSDWNSNSGVSQILNKPYVPVYTENETPYQIRTAPAGNNRTLEKLIGVSCAFNQLVNSGDTSINTTSGHKYVTKINNVWSIIAGGSAVTIVDDSSDIVIDLTAMFGSEVADYLYTLEQNTQGSGVALFRQLFPDSYYAYQTATLISSKPTSKVVVGVNQWDEETELGYYNVANGSFVSRNDGLCSKSDKPIKVLPNTVYTIRVPYASMLANAILFYDADDNYINWVRVDTGGNTPYGTFTTPNNARYVRFYLNASYGTTYHNDISINLPSTDHDYHAYESHTYPLGGDELRGLLKVENGQLVAYGDVKGSDGIIYRYFEERAYASGDESLPNAITDGTNTVVELATPTTSSGMPFTKPMLCGSTEEFTDSRSLKMFCGHDSLYYNSPFKGW